MSKGGCLNAEGNSELCGQLWAPWERVVGEGYTLGSSHFRLVTLAFTSVLSGFCFSYFTFMSLSHAIFKAFFFVDMYH